MEAEENDTGGTGHPGQPEAVATAVTMTAQPTAEETTDSQIEPDFKLLSAEDEMHLCHDKEQVLDEHLVWKEELVLYLDEILAVMPPDGPVKDRDIDWNWVTTLVDSLILKVKPRQLELRCLLYLEPGENLNDPQQKARILEEIKKQKRPLVLFSGIHRYQAALRYQAECEKRKIPEADRVKRIPFYVKIYDAATVPESALVFVAGKDNETPPINMQFKKHSWMERVITLRKYIVDEYRMATPGDIAFKDLLPLTSLKPSTEKTLLASIRAKLEDSKNHTIGGRPVHEFHTKLNTLCQASFSLVGKTTIKQVEPVIRPMKIAACLPPKSFAQARKVYAALASTQQKKADALFNKIFGSSQRTTAARTAFSIEILKEASDEISTPEGAEAFKYAYYDARCKSFKEDQKEAGQTRSRNSTTIKTTADKQTTATNKTPKRKSKRQLTDDQEETDQEETDKEEAEHPNPDTSGVILVSTSSTQPLANSANITPLSLPVDAVPAATETRDPKISGTQTAPSATAPSSPEIEAPNQQIVSNSLPARNVPVQSSTSKSSKSAALEESTESPTTVHRERIQVQPTSSTTERGRKRQPKQVQTAEVDSDTSIASRISARRAKTTPTNDKDQPGSDNSEISESQREISSEGSSAKDKEDTTPSTLNHDTTNEEPVTEPTSDSVNGDLPTVPGMEEKVVLMFRHIFQLFDHPEKPTIIEGKLDGEFLNGRELAQFHQILGIEDSFGPVQSSKRKQQDEDAPAEPPAKKLHSSNV